MSRIATALHRTSTTETPSPRPGFLLLLAIALASVNGALLANSILTLSLRAASIDADGATTVLSIVIGVSSIVSILGYPVIGRLSDRTLSRIGRRRPFLLFGASAIGAGSVLIAIAADVSVLTLGNLVTTLGAVATLVACTALVPDQYPPSRRGLPSAVLGLGGPLGAILGLFLAQAVQPNVTAMIFLPAGVAIAAVLLLAAVMRDRPILRGDRPTFTLRDFIGTLWVNPFTHSSFGLAWWSRFLIFIGVAAVNAYQAFYLIMVHRIDPATVGTSVFVSSLISTGLALVFAPLVGKLSDKARRRKPFVIGSAVVFAIGLGLTATATTFEMFLVAVAVMGVGQGIYFAVDYALIMEVLPDPGNSAKDLGIMNLASSLPSSLVPAMAPALLAVGATALNPQNFTSLFLAGAVAAVLGALLILPIRGVK